MRRRLGSRRPVVPDRWMRVGVGLALALGLLTMPRDPAWAQSDVTVALTAPGQGQSIAGDLEVRGTASGTGFQRYELYYRPLNSDQSFLYFGGGNSPVESQTLGTWPGSSLAAGEYEIQLRAVADGREFETFVTFTLVESVLPTNPATGPEAAGETALEGVGTEAAGAFGDEDALSLRAALDQLALRVRPAALGAYFARGARLAGTLTLMVLAFFGLKALAVHLLRRLRRR